MIRVNWGTARKKVFRVKHGRLRIRHQLLHLRWVGAVAVSFVH